MVTFWVVLRVVGVHVVGGVYSLTVRCRAGRDGLQLICMASRHDIALCVFIGILAERGSVGWFGASLGLG